MPTIAEQATSSIPGNSRITCTASVRSSNVLSTPRKRKLRFNSNLEEVTLAAFGECPITPLASMKLSSPTVRKSPRRCIYSTSHSPSNGLGEEFRNKLNR